MGILRTTLSFIVVLFILISVVISVFDRSPYSVQTPEVDLQLREVEHNLEIRKPPDPAGPPKAAPPPASRAKRTPKHDDIPQLFRENAKKAFDDYKELHRKIMDPADASVPKKFYIHGKCPWGLGNFQIRTMAGLMISMLTKRAFISQDDQYDQYYNYPVEMNVPDEVLQQRFGGNSTIALVVNHTGWDMCSDWEENFKNRTLPGDSPHKFVIAPRRFFGGLPWFAYFHPVHKEFVSKTFGKYFFHFFATFLFSDIKHPEVLEFKRTEEERLYGPLGDPNQQYRLGLQIRWGRGLSDFYLSDFVKDPLKYWVCGDKLLRTQEALGKKGVVFLATDNMDIRNRTVHWFAARQPPVPVLHIDAEVKPESAKHHALVDQQFLEEQDDLVVTQRSTFGFFPQAAGLHTPKVIHRIWDECRDFESSQMGMVTIGGSWPWGTSMCDNQACCVNGGMDEVTAHFGRLI